MTAALLCLAMTIYHEARGEPVLGQLAVAQVVMNRVDSPRFPDDICGVVTQSDQFSYAWSAPVEQGAWNLAVAIAEMVLTGETIEVTRGALHYHRVDIQVYWSVGMVGRRIGDHVFWTEAY